MGRGGREGGGSGIQKSAQVLAKSCRQRHIKCSPFVIVAQLLPATQTRHLPLAPQLALPAPLSLAFTAPLCLNCFPLPPSPPSPSLLRSRKQQQKIKSKTKMPKGQSLRLVPGWTWTTLGAPAWSPALSSASTSALASLSVAAGNS